jgi:hypothetical protein
VRGVDKALAPVAFSAPVTFGKLAESGTRIFSGIAYGGGVVTDHPAFDRVAFDLATTAFDVPAPLLLQHAPSPVGVIKSSVINNRIEISGDLFSDIDEQAKQISAKADRGMPWQLSVGIFPGQIEQVKAGAKVSLNGSTFEGPLTVFRNNRIRETSFCSLGADHTTAARVFGADTPYQFIGSTTPKQATTREEPAMDQAQHDTIVAAKDAEITQLKTALDDLRAQFAAKAKADRIERIKALFTAVKREYTDDAAKAYVDMSDESFAAVDNDLRLSYKPGLDPKTVEEFRAAAVAYIDEQKKVGRTVNLAQAMSAVKAKFAAAAK